jgi:hypothetical protein
MAQSTSDEEATVKAQIEDFVKQNSQTAPGATAPAAEAAPAAAPEATPPATGDDMMADAIKGLVSDAQPEDEKPAEEKVVEPPAPAPTGSMPADVVTPTPAEAPTVEAAKEKEDEQSSSDDDGSTVAHKKIIKPITDGSVAPQSDLSELLAREGITGEEDEAHPFGTPPPNAGSTPQQPQTPGSLPTTPHPPGHVISPNDQGGIDPNSISL